MEKEKDKGFLKDLKMESAEKEERSRGPKKNLRFRAQGQDTTIYEKFKRVERKNNKEDVAFIIKCLNKHFIFFSLMEDVHAIEYLIDHLFYAEVKAGQLIIKQGDMASSFFILHTGKVEVIVNGAVKKEMKPGEGFGELALLYNSERSASIKAVQNCTMWGIDRTTFRKIVEEINTKLYTENRKFINDVKFFDNLTVGEKDDITNLLIKERFVKGQPIVNEGDPANSFYIIKSGEVKIVSKGKEVGRLKEGEYFGENGIMGENQVRSMSVVADRETILLSLGRDSILRVLGNNLQVIIFRNKIRNILSRSPYFSKLGKIHHQRIIDALQVRSAEAGEVICKPGELCRDKMFFVLDGEITKNGEKIDHRGLFFGEDSLNNAKAGLKYEFSIQTTKKGQVAEISFKALNSVVGGSFEEAVIKCQKTDALQAKHVSEVKEKRERMNDQTLNDFVCIKKLGFGQFGSVFLVSSKKTKEVFAMKCIGKAQIVDSKLEKNLEQEKLVLEQVNFPFILHYVRSFKDEYNIYFLLEYIRGMELFDVIREIGLLHTADSQFYVASMILCIEYLHSNFIIYRDLKPENILIDDKGYLRLIDMGTCKIMKGKGVPKTYTIIGTPHYMAPEVLAGKGYSLPVDLWSIGVCLFEFISGYVPYGEEAEDPYEIYDDIIKKPLAFPSYVTDKKVKAIIEQLLNKFAEARSGGSIPALKAHTWFTGFDWDDLMAEKIKPPFIIPDAKMVKLSAIDAMAKSGKSVIEEIKNDSGLKKPGLRKDLDPNWDKAY